MKGMTACFLGPSSSVCGYRIRAAKRPTPVPNAVQINFGRGPDVADNDDRKPHGAADNADGLTRTFLHRHPCVRVCVWAIKSRFYFAAAAASAATADGRTLRLVRRGNRKLFRSDPAVAEDWPRARPPARHRLTARGYRAVYRASHCAIPGIRATGHCAAEAVVK